RDDFLGGACRERTRLPSYWAALKRPPFRCPLREAAIENEHVLRTEEPERPPHPWRGKQPGAVVNNDRVALRDADLSDRLGKLLGRWEHMRQGDRLVGDLVDVKAHRARDVTGEILGGCVTFHRREIERSVDDD